LDWGFLSEDVAEVNPGGTSLMDEDDPSRTFTANIYVLLLGV